MMSEKKLNKLNLITGFSLLIAGFICIFIGGMLLWFTFIWMYPLGLHMGLNNIKVFNSKRFRLWLYWRWVRKTFHQKTEGEKKHLFIKSVFWKLIFQLIQKERMNHESFGSFFKVLDKLLGVNLDNLEDEQYHS